MKSQSSLCKGHQRVGLRVGFDHHICNRIDLRHLVCGNGLELFIQDGPGHRTRSLNQGPLHFRILCIERAQPLFRMDGADAEYEQVWAHAGNLTHRPTSEGSSDLRIDAAANQQQLDPGPSHDTGGDRGIMGGDGEGKVVGQHARKRKIDRADIDINELLRSKQRCERSAQCSFTIIRFAEAHRDRRPGRRSYHRPTVDPLAETARRKLSEIATNCVF